MLRSYAITDIGRRRQLNQDFIYLSETPVGNLPNVFIVADGMGGHNAGDYASRYAVETVVEEIGASFEKNPVKILGRAIEKANRLIRERAREVAAYNGMGTTMVAATCMGRYMEVANVGDSRLYVVNDKIKQITTDHSLVEEMVRMRAVSTGSPQETTRIRTLSPERSGRRIRSILIISAWNSIKAIRSYYALTV